MYVQTEHLNLENNTYSINILLTIKRECTAYSLREVNFILRIQNTSLPGWTCCMYYNC